MLSCRACSRPFEIGDGAREFFAAKGLALPARCAECRAMRRGLTDQTVRCGVCGSSFLWTINSQVFFLKHGLHSPPGRCKKCKAANLRRDASGTVYQPVSNRDALIAIGAWPLEKTEE